MSDLFQTTPPNQRRYGLVIVIGIIAGILSALVKSGVETLLPPRDPDVIAPPVKLLMELGVNVQHEVYTYSEQVVNWGGNGVHILFSIVCAVIYCFASEIFPKVRLLQGLVFGYIAAFSAHGFILPALNLATPLWDAGTDGIISEVVGTGLWAWSIEITRGYLYGKLSGARSR